MSSKRKSLAVWIAVVAPALIVLALLAIVTSKRPSNDELHSLETKGDALLRQLEQHKTERGAYPKQLTADQREGGRFGQWQYKCVDGCTGFVLHVGEYSSHFFGYWYDSREGKWHLDR